MFKTSLAAGALAFAFTSVSASDALESVQKRLDEQQQQIERLSRELAAASKDNNRASDSFFGGYGELHYGNYDAPAKLDFHRFVLFFGHKFADNLRFFSELEVEHSLAGEGKPGEVELEQAYIEHQVSDAFNWKGGLFLLPVGIINETHEPPTFYGVERNRVESDVIPSTWWEGGAGGSFNLAEGLRADFAITSGLKTDATFNLRKGRQKVAEATADALAYTGRIKYNAIPGLELALSLQYQEDLLQGLGVSNDANETASATLREMHAIYQVGGFQLRALHAQWTIDSDVAKAANKDEQKGFYLEPSYRFNDTVGVFTRYSKWNNGSTSATEKKSTQVGVNVWMHANVVLKADYEKISAASDDKGINLGIGYHF